MSIEGDIDRILNAKSGNKEIALFYFPHDGVWRVDAGNRSAFVMLGEVEGELSVEADSLQGAIKLMLKEVTQTNTEGKGGSKV